MLRLFAYLRTSSLVRVCLIVVLASLPLAMYVKSRQEAPEIVEVAPPIEAVEETSSSTLPDFDVFSNVDLKKEAFFSYFHYFIEAENERILGMREKLSAFSAILAHGGDLSELENETLTTLSEQYRLQDSGLFVVDLVDELLIRVDIIPVSLALAQAATESAWGTSRFAREGNNIFGQWCFDEGCGLVPGQRADDKSHEVRAFSTVEASISAYFRNLNTNPSYEYLRELRAQMRMKDKPLDSRALAQGLLRYSERGHVYIAELYDIIRINDLLSLDQHS